MEGTSMSANIYYDSKIIKNKKQKKVKIEKI